MHEDRRVTDTDPNLSDLLDLAVRAARAAGAELLSRYGHVQGLASKSSATDPVSDADLKQHTGMVRLGHDARDHFLTLGRIDGEGPDAGDELRRLQRQAHSADGRINALLFLRGLGNGLRTRLQEHILTDRASLEVTAFTALATTYEALW